MRGARGRELREENLNDFEENRVVYGIPPFFLNTSIQILVFNTELANIHAAAYTNIHAAAYT